MIFQAGGKDNNSNNLSGLRGVNLGCSFIISLLDDSAIKEYYRGRMVNAHPLAPYVRIIDYYPRDVSSDELTELVNRQLYLLHWIAEVRAILMYKSHLFIVFGSTDFIF